MNALARLGVNSRNARPLRDQRRICHPGVAMPPTRRGVVFSEATPRLSRLFALVPLVCMAAQVLLADESTSSDEQTITSYTFRRYQAERPYVKRIVFEHWDKKKYGPNYYWAEGAFPPGGYYLLYPTNSPFTTNMCVSGLSAEHECSYSSESRSLTFAPSESWNRWGDSITLEGLRILLSAVYLGIPCLPGAFTWRSDTEFEFRNNELGGLRYIGRILRSDGTNPLELVYEAVTPPYYPKCRVVYLYKEHRALPPARIDLTVEWKNMTEEMRFLLHHVEVGVDPLAGKGYHLQDFLHPTNEIRDVYCYSNRVLHVVLADGTMRPYRFSTPPTEPSTVRWSARGALLVIVLAVTGVLIFHWRGKRQTQASTTLQKKPIP